MHGVQQVLSIWGSVVSFRGAASIRKQAYLKQLAERVVSVARPDARGVHGCWTTYKEVRLLIKHHIVCSQNHSSQPAASTVGLSCTHCQGVYSTWGLPRLSCKVAGCTLSIETIRLHRCASASMLFLGVKLIDPA